MEAVLWLIKHVCFVLTHLVEKFEKSNRKSLSFFVVKVFIWLYTKFEKFERESLRIIMIKVFLFHYIRQNLQVCCNQKFEFD